MDKKVLRLATPSKRLFAYIIDSIIPFVLGCIALIAFVSLVSYSDSSMNSFSYGYDYDLGIELNQGSSIGSVVALFVVFFMYIAYLAVQIYFYTKSKTIGKSLLKIEVVSSKNGEPIGFGLMLLREWFAKKAVGSILWLGYIWILIDDKNRGWHDKIMDTYVVDVKEERYQSE